MIFADIEFNSDIDFKHEYLVQTDDGKINVIFEYTTDINYWAYVMRVINKKIENNKKYYGDDILIKELLNLYNISDLIYGTFKIYAKLNNNKYCSRVFTLLFNNKTSYFIFDNF